MQEYNYKMIIAYDGTQYNGWQIQPNGIAIQQKIEETLKIVLRHPTSLIGSGRTDAGVHALGQVANFKTSLRVEPRRFLHSLNGILPKDIRIHSLENVPLNFNARYSAKGKIYHYYLHLKPTLNPFNRLYSLHVGENIDSNSLKEAAQLFIGTHDFTAFANEAHSGVAAHDPIRTLQRLDVVPTEEGLCLEFEAEGFLYKMVRNITGTLLEIACNKRSISSIPEIFASKDRRCAGKSAPPHALFLMKVIY
ncbi:tRNA pseudouridine synthase A 1 [Neochlamydia sp. EPS4]|uniref:tRNA pseudouridine(38-40) synthase TruA n=1 Tax=Neochlamydia sp. EPS4 TaxID=1478175 RepID=UPI0005832CF4|nr:tRNA pseudouridine(38-40) synthase TruA [Neochlamydia sp. EPS4]KIC75398.1 tRNA pseudouridine synthase A 1 [Neochlamydia sp. EPS4]